VNGRSKDVGGLPEGGREKFNKEGWHLQGHCKVDTPKCSGNKKTSQRRKEVLVEKGGGNILQVKICNEEAPS